MKKLLIVTDFYLPHRSGITTYIENLIYILKNEFKITILTGNYNKKLKRLEKYKNIKIIRSNISFSFNRGFYSFKLIKDFMDESKKADYINIHFPIAEIFPLTFLTKKPILLNYHCLPNGNSFFSKILFIYFYFFGFISSLLSKKVIVFTKDYFYSFFINKLIKKNLIEILPFIRKNSITSNYKNAKKEKIIKIGYLGRMSEEKGLEHLIEASKIMKVNKIKHSIYIAGDYEDKRFSKNINILFEKSQNNKNIHFLGKISEKRKHNFYNSIDVLILPSTNSFEAFGLVQLEAMSYGKPVIASNMYGVRIPIQYTGNGLLFKKGNVNELVQCITSYYFNKKNTKKNIINNYKKYFNKNKFKKSYLSIFN